MNDVKGMEKMKKLEWMSINGNKLTNVKGMEKLTKLEKLNLDGNKLTDVKGLEKLSQLRLLALQSNPDLTKAQIAELHNSLPKCQIRSNPTK